MFVFVDNLNSLYFIQIVPTKNIFLSIQCIRSSVEHQFGMKFSSFSSVSPSTSTAVSNSS